MKSSVKNNTCVSKSFLKTVYRGRLDWPTHPLRLSKQTVCIFMQNRSPWCRSLVPGRKINIIVLPCLTAACWCREGREGCREVEQGRSWQMHREDGGVDAFYQLRRDWVVTLRTIWGGSIDHDLSLGFFNCMVSMLRPWDCLSIYVFKYKCRDARLLICMNVFIYVCAYTFSNVCVHTLCMHLCRFVYMHVCMFVFCK